LQQGREEHQAQARTSSGVQPVAVSPAPAPFRPAPPAEVDPLPFDCEDGQFRFF
jgi:hypothetical protein